MSHKTTRKGGRSWWGKLEAKLAGRVTRRRDDRAEARRPHLHARWDVIRAGRTYDTTEVVESPQLAAVRRITPAWWLWDNEAEVFHSGACLRAWEMIDQINKIEGNVDAFRCRHNVWMDPDYAREQADEANEPW